jgi:hypothetical protein
MFSEQWHKEPDTDDGVYFIDRSPEFFQIILDHLRGYEIFDSNKNIMEDYKQKYFSQTQTLYNLQIQRLKNEVAFYNIHSLLELMTKYCRNCNADIDEARLAAKKCFHMFQPMTVHETGIFPKPTYSTTIYSVPMHATRKVSTPKICSGCMKQTTRRCINCNIFLCHSCPNKECSESDSSMHQQ